MLTDGQKNYFNTFGFLIMRQVFTSQEMDIIRHESDRILLENRQGKPFPGKRRQAVMPFFEKSPDLIRFVEDDRIYELGFDLLGPGFVMVCTEGNLHVGDTQWHGGTSEAAVVPHIKIAIYLESTTSDTGALRVIPGSNHPEVRQHLMPLKAQYEDPSVHPFGISGVEMPCQIFESEPGDIIVFSEDTWHAAFGGAPGRSQHAINFMATPATDEEVAHLKKLHDGWVYALHPHEALINSDRPRLRGMVEKLLELGFEPAPPPEIFE